MVTEVSAAAVVDLCAAFIAVEILSFLGPQLVGADPSAQVPLLDSAVELLLPLGALGALAAAVGGIYRHLQHSTAAAGAAGNRRLSGLLAILCASVGTLDFFFFVLVNPAGIGGDAGAQARAPGLAAARVLPAAAAATFFLGMALIIVAHIRAGGEGGGGAFAAADGQIQGQGPVLFLTKAAFAAAAALAWLMAMALSASAATPPYTEKNQEGDMLVAGYS